MLLLLDYLLPLLWQGAAYGKYPAEQGPYVSGAIGMIP